MQRDLSDPATGPSTGGSPDAHGFDMFTLAPVPLWLEDWSGIRALADDGRVVLFRSTELPEPVGLADRILVFYRGRLTSELPGTDATDHDVLHAINTGLPPGRLADPPSSTQEGAP